MTFYSSVYHRLYLSFLRRHILLVLGLGLVLGFILAAGLGEILFTPLDIFAVIGRFLGLVIVSENTLTEDFIFLHLRLPRVLLAMLVGASLAASGAAMQGLFRNPLADPMLTGASAGAAVAAIVMLASGFWVFHIDVPMLLPLVSFVGSLVVVLAVYGIARKHDSVDVTSLLLAGIAFNALAASIIGFFYGDCRQYRITQFYFLDARQFRGCDLDAVCCCIGPRCSCNVRHCVGGTPFGCNGTG